MAGKVSDSDKGWKKTLARMDKAKFGAVLQVGIVGDEAESEHGEDGLTVSELGEIHEFGLGVPQRSFIGGWSDEMAVLHAEQLRKVAKAVVSGKLESWEQGLERLGNLFVAQVQKRISDGIEPGLEEATVKRKGSSVPLIDTGVLRSSITYKVVRK